MGGAATGLAGARGWDDPEVRYQGSVGADGLLLAGPERAGGAVTPEPRLTERLVERALETGARVTPVEGAARAALSEAEGIAARLRRQDPAPASRRR